MTIGIYYCYAYHKDSSTYDTANFEGEALEASVAAQHWAADLFEVNLYAMR